MNSSIGIIWEIIMAILLGWMSILVFRDTGSTFGARVYRIGSWLTFLFLLSFKHSFFWALYLAALNFFLVLAITGRLQELELQRKAQRERAMAISSDEMRYRICVATGLNTNTAGGRSLSFTECEKIKKKGWWPREWRKEELCIVTINDLCREVRY